jgi:cold shock CspA family protein
MTVMTKSVGLVLFFRKEGWGFLRAIETGDEIFVHLSNVIGKTRLIEGDTVRFHIGPGKAGQGLQAISVELVERAVQQ